MLLHSINWLILAMLLSTCNCRSTRIKRSLNAATHSDGVVDAFFDMDSRRDDLPSNFDELRYVPDSASIVRDLDRLYALLDRKKRAQETRNTNGKRTNRHWLQRPSDDIVVYLGKPHRVASRAKRRQHRHKPKCKLSGRERKKQQMMAGVAHKHKHFLEQRNTHEDVTTDVEGHEDRTIDDHAYLDMEQKDFGTVTEFPVTTEYYEENHKTHAEQTTEHHEVHPEEEIGGEPNEVHDEENNSKEQSTEDYEEEQLEEPVSEQYEEETTEHSEDEAIEQSDEEAKHRHEETTEHQEEETTEYSEEEPVDHEETHHEEEDTTEYNETHNDEEHQEEDEETTEHPEEEYHEQEENVEQEEHLNEERTTEEEEETTEHYGENHEGEHHEEETTEYHEEETTEHHKPHHEEHHEEEEETTEHHGKHHEGGHHEEETTEYYEEETTEHHKPHHEEHHEEEEETTEHHGNHHEGGHHGEEHHKPHHEHEQETTEYGEKEHNEQEENVNEEETTEHHKPHYEEHHGLEEETTEYNEEEQNEEPTTEHHRHHETEHHDEEETTEYSEETTTEHHKPHHDEHHGKEHHEEETTEHEKEVSTEEYEEETTTKEVETSESTVTVAPEELDMSDELPMKNKAIHLTGNCNNADFLKMNHCICSVKTMLKDVLDDMRDIETIKTYEYDCSRFIRIEPGIVLGTADRGKMLQKRRIQELMEQFGRTDGARVGRDIDSLLKQDIDVHNSGNKTFVTRGTQIRLPCINDGSESELSSNTIYTWTVGDGSPETVGNLANNGSTLVIADVSPEDSNNYTCILTDQMSTIPRKEFHQELCVVALPTYSLTITVALDTSGQHCTPADLEMVQRFYPEVLQELVCNENAAVCNVALEKPKCTHLNMDNVISMHAKLFMQPLSRILPKMDTALCDLVCQSKVYSMIVDVTLKNFASVTNLPVFFRYKDEQKEVTPVHYKNGGETNAFANAILTLCEAGFGIYDNPKLCYPCEAHSFNAGNAMKCIPCPKGTFQPSVGSHSCTPCTTPFQHMNCFLPNFTTGVGHKYYLIPFVVMAVTLLIIITCILGSRYSHKKLKRRRQKMKSEILMSEAGTSDRKTIGKKTPPEPPPIDF